MIEKKKHNYISPQKIPKLFLKWLKIEYLI